MINFPRKEKLDIEIEKKFVLSGFPDDLRKNFHSIINIEQYYEPLDKGVIRYRHSSYKGGESFEKIVKIPIGKGTCSEETIPITREKFYDEIHSDMRFIRKTRYVTHCGLKYEVDVFDNLNLVILEVEVDSLDEKILFPDCLKDYVIAEVTGIKGFSNYDLSMVKWK